MARSPVRAFLIASLSPMVALAQATTGAARDSSRTVALPPVEIVVTRDPGAARLTAPYAISVTGRSRLDARGLAQDVLAGVPGLFVASRNNPTQDPRIVIRGFGARTAFGVRGVRVLHDGIPLTVADGQTPLDYLDTEAVARVEVIRGSASALYGNSAGGVVAFSSPSLDSTRREGGVLTGSHGVLRSDVRMTGRARALQYSAGLNHASEDGFREHARQRVTRANARVRGAFAGSSVTAHLLAFNMPLAENPGALTAAQLAADRRMAEPLAVTRAAGKAVSHAQAGLAFAREISGGEISAIVFAGRRALENPLTFAVIDLDRTTSGLLLRASRGLRGSRMTIGLDTQRQDDDRREHENCHDAATENSRCPSLAALRGSVRRTQRELVSSIGPYASAELLLGRRYRLSGAVRGDVITFDVRDRLVTATDPDESGGRTMRAVSPQLGVVALVTGRSSVYANLSSAFETPTATELGNKPDGSAGVNAFLKPQRARTIEVGVKGAVSRAAYDLAVFTTAVQDELVPFEIAGGAGRRFFRNAGRTRRRGVELSVAAELGRLALRSAATYSDFEFVDFRTATSDFSGRTIPGVPAGFAEAEAVWSTHRIQLGLSGRFVSSVPVDDANTAHAPGYELVNLRARAELRIGRAVLFPAVAVDNVFSRKYVGAVSVNAAGGRYFEPAPGRTMAAALSVRF